MIVISYLILSYLHNQSFLLSVLGHTCLSYIIWHSFRWLMSTAHILPLDDKFIPLSLWKECHIHKIMWSATPDLHSNIHQLQSTLTQVTVRTLWTSVYILLHSIPCTFDSFIVDLLLGFHHSCVQLWTQLWLYFSSISAFVYIEYNLNSVSVYKLNVLSTYLSYPQNRVKCNSGSPLSCPPTLEHSLYSSLLCSYTFDPSVLDSLLGFHCSCVWLQI